MLYGACGCGSHALRAGRRLLSATVTLRSAPYTKKRTQHETAAVHRACTVSCVVHTRTLAQPHVVFQVSHSSTHGTGTRCATRNTTPHLRSSLCQNKSTNLPDHPPWCANCGRRVAGQREATAFCHRDSPLRPILFLFFLFSFFFCFSVFLFSVFLFFLFFFFSLFFFLFCFFSFILFFCVSVFLFFFFTFFLFFFFFFSFFLFFSFSLFFLFCFFSFLLLLLLLLLLCFCFCFCFFFCLFFCLFFCF